MEILNTTIKPGVMRFKFYGIGGQGTKTLASGLGELLSETWQTQLAVTATYDTIVRGTDVEANLVISQTRINSPEVVESDFCIIFNSPTTIIKSKVYFADISKKEYLENEALPTYGKTQYFELLKTATELGSPIYQNTVALGVLLKACQIDIAKIEITKYLPTNKTEENIKAVNAGYLMYTPT